MKQLPKLPPGTRWEDTASSHWQNMVDAVNWLMKRNEALSHQLVLLKQHPSITGERARPPSVVVVVGTETEPPRLRCRRIRFSDTWPEPCTDEGDCFLRMEEPIENMHCWPGKTIDDYDSEIFEGDDDDLDTSVTYFTAHFVQGKWLVEKPSADASLMRFAVVQGISGFMLTVQFVKFNQEVLVAGTGDAWVADGEPREVETYANYLGSLYDEYTRFQTPGSPSALYALCANIQGRWHALQLIPQELGPRVSGASGNCDVT
jgi:hypothetical protein